MNELYEKSLKLVKELDQYESYKVEIYDKGQTISFIKNKEENETNKLTGEDTYSIGFQIPNRNDYEDYDD